jgi:hypothetical protein
VRTLTSVALFVHILLPALARAQPPPGDASAHLPASAVAALDRANAAYDYGDMIQVVDSARPIVDGALVASPGERLQALRLLGIGLYLTGRPTGAEAAFLDLLRSNRHARLDPTSTRPEVVAFFEEVRRRHAPEIQDAARVRSRRSIIWNFLPPFGQFKNGDRARGFVILGLEVASFATALTTRLVLDSWQQPFHTFPGHESSAATLRTVNQVAVGVLAATWLVGVADAFLRSDHEPDSPEPTFSLQVFPLGRNAPLAATLTARF